MEREQMETMYINDGKDGIPERIDYENTEIFSGEYDNVGRKVYTPVIAAWLVDGYQYQERKYIGEFWTKKEIIEFVKKNILA